MKMHDGGFFFLFFCGFSRFFSRCLSRSFFFKTLWFRLEPGLESLRPRYLTQPSCDVCNVATAVELRMTSSTEFNHFGDILHIIYFGLFSF
ncbi:Uncharacterized protein APZ42_029488 [Daphnia magna]|uniref:Uncharacterized protein n=1 Tax=Daphnia magna TaxID=35525 RepID=A0A164PKY8_9CRUS|nr:Uncharacterized protein APZ42_029488 [Daphnia magna]